MRAPMSCRSITIASTCAQHFRGRLARLAVEREHRHLAAAVVAVRRLDHVVLHVGSESVLRTEQRADRDARRVHQRIDDVHVVGVDGCGIGDDADLAAL